MMDEFHTKMNKTAKTLHFHSAKKREEKKTYNQFSYFRESLSADWNFVAVGAGRAGLLHNRHICLYLYNICRKFK